MLTRCKPLLAPRGTPAAIIEKVNREVERILALPDVKEKAIALGCRLLGGTPGRVPALRDR